VDERLKGRCDAQTIVLDRARAAALLGATLAEKLLVEA
jgi:hypothetical protein